MEKFLLVVVALTLLQLYCCRRKKTARARLEAAIQQRKNSNGHQLVTEDLIEIPARFINGLIGNREITNRTFGFQEWFLMVFDECGRGWIGPISRKTLESMRKGGYAKLAYTVFPICSQLGSNTIDTYRGKVIRHYPTWLTHKEYFDETARQQFQRWIELYNVGYNEFGCPPNYIKIYSLFEEYFPPEIIKTNLASYDACLTQI